MSFVQRINDGWKNVLAGIGAKRDKTERTIYGVAPFIPDQELTQLWMGDGLSKKIISAVSGDMVRAGVEIDGDEDGEIAKEMRNLKWQSYFTEALNWARLYGGSVLVLGVADGNGLDKPIRSSGGKIEWIKVYPRTRVIVSQANIVTDPDSPYFEDVEVFPIQKLDGTMLQVHTTRCLVFRGEAMPLDAQVDFTQRYWGMSTLQPLYEQLRSFGAGLKGVSNVMLEFIIGKYTLSNLAEILAENNVSAVYNRLEVINASKSMINAVLLGEGESYERDVASVSGLPELLDRLMMMVSGISGIPVTRLFGRSPAGMNSTGESDLTNYYDMIAAKQEEDLLDPVTRLAQLVARSQGVNPEDISVEFLPVWEPSHKQLIDMQQKQASTDKTYLDMGVLSADEIREARFVGKQSFTTVVEGLAPEPEDPEDDMPPSAGTPGNPGNPAEGSSKPAQTATGVPDEQSQEQKQRGTQAQQENNQ